MITIVKALNQVTGAELILLGALLCILIFTAAFALFKSNRSKKAIFRYLMSTIIIFELCDLIWISYLFPNGEYINRGLIGAHIFLILPLFLIFLNIFLTYINKQNLKKI